jgi:hypothetical protein
MATKAKKRTVKSWDRDAEKMFRDMVKQGVPTAKMARTLKRSPASVRSKAQKLGVSLSGARKRTAGKR